MAEKFAEVIAPAEKPNVPTRGLQDLATAGRRLGQLGNEQAAAIREGSRAVEQGFQATDQGLTQLDQHLTQADVLHGSATYATAEMNLAQQWDTFQKNNPNMNPREAAQQFQENVVVPTYDQIGDNFTTKGGRAYATQHSAAAIEHWGNYLSNQAATTAGHQAAGAVATINNNLSGMVATDVDHLPLAIGSLQHAYEELANTLPPTQAASIRGKEFETARQKLIDDAITAKINKDPNDPTISSMIQSYNSYLGGEAVNRLTQHQKAQQKLVETQQNADYNQQKKIAIDNWNATADALIAEALPKTNGGSVLLPDNFFTGVGQLSTKEGADPARIKQLYDFGKAIQNEQARGTPDQTSDMTRNDFTARIYSPTNPYTMRELMEAKIDHSLSDKDFKLYHGMVEQRDKQNDSMDNSIITSTMQRVKAAYGFVGGDPSTASPEGAEAFQNFQIWFTKSSRAAQASGMSIAEFIATQVTNDRIKSFYGDANLPPPPKIGNNPGSGIPPGGVQVPIPSAQAPIGGPSSGPIGRVWDYWFGKP